MTPGARAAAAIAILERIDATRAPADAVAGAHFRANRYIGAKDRAAVAGAVYGVLRKRGQLDWWIAQAGFTPDARTRALAWLALGEGWDAARIAGAFDGGRYRPAALNEAERALAARLAGHTLDHPEQDVAVRHNLPGWIVPALRESIGAGWEREFAALGEAAPLDLRANALKTGREGAQEALARAGIAAEPTRWSPLGLRVAGHPPLSATQAFRDGLVEVQDEGSQLAALLADAHPGMRVCDLCAGAGGKTLALAAGMRNRGHIDACDVSNPRLEAARKRLRRAGASNYALHKLADERDPWLKRRAGGYDRVFVDAPCTGTGTWRRNPDARWTLAQADIDELVVLQARILDAAARLVKPGGRLVYVTCSLLAAENQVQAASFLARQPSFRAVPVHEVWAARIGAAPPGVAGDARLAPARAGTDGFYVAVFAREAA